MSLPGLLFNPSGVAADGLCLALAPGLTWLHAGSDAVILLSYLSISVALIWLLRRRPDGSHRWIAYLFVVFFLTCSTIDGLAIVTAMLPAYWTEALAKAVTAAASVSIASILWIMVPWLAGTLSPAELTNLNAELSNTVAKQEATLRELLDIEQKLRNSNSRLEKNVARYAADLRISNTRLLKRFNERLAAQALLAKTEAEYRASFETATIGKVQIEPLSGRLLRVNSAFARMLGYDAKELAGRDIWDFAYPDDRAAALTEFGRMLAGEIDVFVVEERFLRHDGVPVWVRMSATVVMDPGVKLPRLALAEIENIDLRHDVQAALRASDLLLRLALDSGGFGVWVFDIGKGLFWSDGRASAMTAGAVPADTWLALSGPEYAAWTGHIHPDDRDRREAALQAVFAGAGELVQTEYRAGRADGGWSVLSDRCMVVERDPATGLPVRAVCVAADTTEQTRALTDARTAKADLDRGLAQRRAVLAHRRLLLREVYHRMNDTLRLVDRLFATVAKQLGDVDVSAELADQRSRICALGLVHEELMTSVDVDTFDIAPFLHELCHAVLPDGADQASRMLIHADELKVTLGYAIPLGLLVTELLNNVRRHARSKDGSRIEVKLRRSAQAELTLTVSGGATGAADETQTAAFAAGLETRLVRDLLCQLGAEARVCADGGLKAEVAIFHRPA